MHFSDFSEHALHPIDSTKAGYSTPQRFSCHHSGACWVPTCNHETSEIHWSQSLAKTRVKHMEFGWIDCQKKLKSAFFKCRIELDEDNFQIVLNTFTGQFSIAANVRERAVRQTKSSIWPNLRPCDHQPAIRHASLEIRWLFYLTTFFNSTWKTNTTQSTISGNPNTFKIQNTSLILFNNTNTTN